MDFFKPSENEHFEFVITSNGMRTFSDEAIRKELIEISFSILNVYDPEEFFIVCFGSVCPLLHASLKVAMEVKKGVRHGAIYILHAADYPAENEYLQSYGTLKSAVAYRTHRGLSQKKYKILFVVNACSISDTEREFIQCVESRFSSNVTSVLVIDNENESSGNIHVNKLAKSMEVKVLHEDFGYSRLEHHGWHAKLHPWWITRLMGYEGMVVVPKLQLLAFYFVMKVEMEQYSSSGGVSDKCRILPYERIEGLI